MMISAAMILVWGSYGLADRLELPHDLTTIEDEVFYGNESLTEVILPEGLEVIGSKAFRNCPLTSIILPDSLRVIADDALNEPGTIEVIANKGSYAYQWARKNHYTDYIFTHETVTVDIPFETVYKDAPNWYADEEKVLTEGRKGLKEITYAVTKDLNGNEISRTVSSEKIKIDKPNNYLEYESDALKGIQCNALSTSIISLYNKYAGGGLFDLNIRKYIKNTLVDSGIKKTLDSDRENFWFLNNGIIIACTDFDVDGDTVRLQDFSIVNGGQTTTLIGTYKGTNTKEFYIPCKIVATKNEATASYFYTKIAEATNSQKPIYPRDLKSNSPEMVKLHNWLEQEGIWLEIKRGQKVKKNFKYIIKNDELGQILLSFVHQLPGTSRNGKKKIFDTAATYDKLFKNNYEKDILQKGFIKDLIELDSRYSAIEKS